MRLHVDHITRLALGAHHQDGAALAAELAHKLHRLLELRQRLLEVDDVNLVAMAVNERRHLGVPEAGLVSEMDARFQHFTHGD